MDDNYTSSGATAPSFTTEEGALWFDETTDIMKVYNGNAWQSAGSSVNGTSERQTYTATAGQTVFNATYDSGFVDVYLNGLKLADSDFTATNGTTIVLTSGATAGDIVDIVAYGTFELADVYTQAQADSLLADKADANVTYTETEVDNLLDAKQDTLASGTNIKTVNSNTILGSGNLDVSLPAGFILMMADNDVLSGYLECDGSSLSTTTYSALFNRIGYLYGGSGSSFNIPDLRGEFIRGWDNGRGSDPSRAIGSHQKGSIMIIPGDHSMTMGNSKGAQFFDDSEGITWIDHERTTSNLTDNGLTGNPPNASTWSTHFGTVRPRNTALMFCIKY